MVQIVLRHILSHGIHIIRDLDLIGTKVQIKSHHFSTDLPKIMVLMVMQIARYTTIKIHYNGYNAFYIYIKYIYTPASSWNELAWSTPGSTKVWHLRRCRHRKFSNIHINSWIFLYSLQSFFLQSWMVSTMTNVGRSPQKWPSRRRDYVVTSRYEWWTWRRLKHQNLTINR